MDVEPADERRRAPKRSRRVLLQDPAAETADSGTKKPRDRAPDFPPPVETPSAPVLAPAVSRAPDELVVVCVGERGDSSALAKIPPAVRARAVLDLVGDVEEVRKLRSGALVFVTRSVDQVRTLLSLRVFCDIPVHMPPPKSRSTAVYGVISGVDIDADATSLRAALLEAGATEYMRLQRRAADGSLRDTRSVLVAFPAGLPAFIRLNFERLPVRPFVHRPLQCFRCQRYGHGASNCRSAPRCGRCSGPHVTRDCAGGTDRCAVCHAAHPAWSRTCAFNARARQIETIRATEGLSYAAAVRRVPPAVQEPSIPSLRSVVSVETQTDFCVVPSKPRTADAETSTRGSLAPTRLPKSSSLLVHNDEPDGPEFLLLRDSDIPRFLDICVRIFRSSSQSLNICDLASRTLDDFLCTLPAS